MKQVFKSSSGQQSSKQGIATAVVDCPTVSYIMSPYVALCSNDGLQLPALSGLACLAGP